MDFVSFFTAQCCNHSFCLYCDVVFLKLEGRSGCSRFPVVNSQCILDGYGFCNFLHSISRFPPIDYKCPANIFLCDSNYVDARTYAPKSRTAPPWYESFSPFDQRCPRSNIGDHTRTGKLSHLLYYGHCWMDWYYNIFRTLSWSDSLLALAEDLSW